MDELLSRSFKRIDDDGSSECIDCSIATGAEGGSYKEMEETEAIKAKQWKRRGRCAKERSR